jgi:hypothetical protein
LCLRFIEIFYLNTKYSSLDNLNNKTTRNRKDEFLTIEKLKYQINKEINYQLEYKFKNIVTITIAIDNIDNIRTQYVLPIVIQKKGSIKLIKKNILMINRNSKNIIILYNYTSLSS